LDHLGRPTKGSGAPGNRPRPPARPPPCSCTASTALGSDTMAVVPAFIALLVEAAVGYPAWLMRAIGHPVTWIGAIIKELERGLNRPDWRPASRRAAGALALAVVIAMVAVVSIGIERRLLALPFGFVIAGLLASTLLAQRSLHEHVARVAEGLEQKGLAGGR